MLKPSGATDVDNTATNSASQAASCLSFAELERQLAKALRQRNEQTACELHVELGEEYRRAGRLHASLSHYRRCVALAEKLDSNENLAFAHRAIAEILILSGKYNSFLH